MCAQMSKNVAILYINIAMTLSDIFIQTYNRYDFSYENKNKLSNVIRFYFSRYLQ